MSRHLGSLVLTAVLLVAAAGCSDDSAPDPEPTGPGSETSPTQSPPSATSEPSVTTEPSEPTAPAATGPQLRQEHLSVHAPEGWAVTKENDTITGFAQDEVLLSTLMISEVEDPNPGVTITLDEMARDSVKSGQYLRDPEILEPVEIGGVLWFHTSGQIDDAQYEDVFGTVTDGVILDIAITTVVDMVPRREREELVDSILASVQLD